MRKWIIWAIVALLLLCGYELCWRWLSEDDMRPPDLPIESAPNQLILTSNGCCFFVDDIVVTAGDVPLAEQKKLYEHDICRYELPNELPMPVKLHVAFECYYGETVPFSMDVLNIDNMQAIKKTGVLLYFQEHDDMYLNVIAGNDRTSYKMNADGERWQRQIEPNKIYS